MVGFQVEAGPMASSLSGFWNSLRKARGLPVDEALNDLAASAASNDIAAVGRLLGPRDVNTVNFDEGNLPESLVRRPLKCSLLDVAAGSGSVEMTKYLLEFHGAKPTRETLKMAMSTGSLEMIKLLRERLPEPEREARGELLEVAAEFHQWEVLLWVLRDSTVFDSELLAVFALERRLADALVVVFASGLRCWSSRTNEAAAKWRASLRMDFGPAPEGFSSSGGWWTDLSGSTSPLPAFGCPAGGSWKQGDPAVTDGTDTTVPTFSGT
jgi:hypothetical protein